MTVAPFSSSGDAARDHGLADAEADDTGLPRGWALLIILGVSVALWYITLVVLQCLVGGVWP
jgi:hypothetical protein